MMRFLPVNLDALLVELDDLAQTLALLGSNGFYDQDILFTDLLVQGVDAGDTASSLRAIQFIRLARILKLIRLMKGGSEVAQSLAASRRDSRGRPHAKAARPRRGQPLNPPELKCPSEEPIHGRFAATQRIAEGCARVGSAAIVAPHAAPLRAPPP